MPWWGWLLLAWGVLAVAGALVLGAAIAEADRREHARLKVSWGERSVSVPE